MYETELYEPVKRLFENMGYTVMAEVLDCDAIAQKDNERIAIELKTSFNLKLLYQIVERQSVCRIVYGCIPRPKNIHSKRWKETTRLMKRLGGGLILVSDIDGKKYAEIALEAKEHTGYINAKKSKKVTKELSSRSHDYNIGGSTKKKLVTAYRENAIFIACCLLIKGDMTTTQIKKYGTGDKTATILKKNYYDWFEKTDDGLHHLTQSGYDGINEYSTIADIYIDKINEIENAE
ncbi:MAG: DUF2161 family putative PD-(D/E)XK-type phosphodiesterase [Eubacteriales bacterium]|nr:DUF2161 family putative PD-(D/E)XK-type phosphodiesterase [Eubacteriales bacterium]